MKQKFIIQEHHPRLLLFFAGWGADETPFKSYHPTHSDYMISYDYRDLFFNAEDLAGYSEINLVGWSMGVWAATQLFGTWNAKCNLPIKSRIALNGTPYPIDEQRGIPPHIYEGTLDGLSGASLHKFLRRMCAGKEAFREFLTVTPTRPLAELKEELIRIKEMYLTLPTPTFQWQETVIGTNDRIIPPENQLKAWQGIQTLQTEDAHYQAELFHYYLEERWTKN